MTRKRFIKLLMSYGTSRNEAQRLADRAKKDNCSYGKAFAPYFYKIMLERIHREMFDALFNIPVTLKFVRKESDNNAEEKCHDV